MSGEDSSNSWRVFCAVELPQTVRLRVLQHIARLREAVPDVKASWSRDANIHLTLKFVGEIPRTSVPNFSNAAGRAVEAFTPFTIRLEQTGVFPKHGLPRVLWIGIGDSSGKLDQLHARLENACSNEGFGKDPRRFHPHLTVARLRNPQGTRTLAETHMGLAFEPVEVVVSELVVIRSELGGGGSTYTVISRHLLKA